MMGHADAWNYGFSAFLSASKAAEKFRRRMRKEISVAIAEGAGLLFAKEDEQKKFLEDKQNGTDN